MSKKYQITRTLIFTIVSLTFLAFGVWQLMGKMNADFVRWRFPLWTIYLIGGTSVLGAIGIWFKRTAFYATFVLTVITIVAIFTLIGHHEWPIPMLPPVALFLLLCAIFRYNG